MINNTTKFLGGAVTYQDYQLSKDKSTLFRIEPDYTMAIDSFKESVAFKTADFLYGIKL